jgi:hypothetical protein
MLMWRNLKSLVLKDHVQRQQLVIDQQQEVARRQSQSQSQARTQSQQARRSRSLARSSRSQSRSRSHHSLSHMSTSLDHDDNDSEDEEEIDEEEEEEEDVYQQHRSRQYDQLVRDLMNATIPADSHGIERTTIDADRLHITLAEETAEMYILGRNHWEYSKVCTISYILYYDI